MKDHDENEIVHAFAVYARKNVTIFEYGRHVRGCFVSRECEPLHVHRIKPPSLVLKWPDSGLTHFGERLRDMWFSIVPMPLFLPIRAKRSDELIFVWRGGKRFGRVAFTLWKRRRP